MDAKKIGAAYGRIAKLRQGQIEANVDARNQIQALLTKEQKDQIKTWRQDFGPRGNGRGYGAGLGMMRLFTTRVSRAPWNGASKRGCSS